MRDDVTASVDPASGAVAPSAIGILAPGSRLGDRYEVRRVIGSGGQAVVYLAVDRDIRREVALKVLRADRSSDALEKRFRREAAIARDVAHPNVVRIFDVESTGAAMYLTMEFVDGESLRGRIERGSLPIDEAISIARQMLRGIEALHSIDIIHRDIKPGNVLITADGAVKIADFGLARHLITEESKATNTGALLGTIDYLSPEQALGRDIDFRSDLYSAGVVMFEMLTGGLPFSAKSQLGIMLARLKTAAPDVRKLRDDCPRWLAKVVARLLEQHPSERYASASDVLADLDRRHARFRIRRPAALAAFGAAAALLALLVTGYYSFTKPRFGRLVAANGGITAVDTGGHALWSRPSLASDIEQSWTMARVDGRTYVAIVPWNRASIRNARHVLELIEPATGRVARTFDLSNTHVFDLNTREFVPQPITAVDLDHDGSDELVIPFCHRWNWPSYTMLVEPRIGRSRMVFVASGHHRLAAVADVDGDGRDDLLFAGINNVLGWYNAIAAVRIDPPVDQNVEGTSAFASTPDSWYSFSASLLWYQLLPRAVMHFRPDVRIEGKSVVFRSIDGSVFKVGLDGLSAGGAPHAPRLKARQEAYEHLREGRRLFAAGSQPAALAELQSAVSAAQSSGEPLLVESLMRQQGRMLISSGNERAGESILMRLAAKSPNESEIMFDAAQALHLRGASRRAAELYIQGFRGGARPDQGKSKQDFLEGAVLALVDDGRFNEALAAADQFGDAFPESRPAAVMYREYARWRSGKLPHADAVDAQWNATDFSRTCSLEMRLAAGADPASILRAVDAAAESNSEMRSGILSLHAQALWSLGRPQEAAGLISRAHDLAQSERVRSTWARALYPLVEERYRRMVADAIPERRP